VGSNPTPRAYLGVLHQNNKRKSVKKSNNRYNLSQLHNNASSQSDGETSQDKKSGNEVLHNKIISITSNCSKGYFRKILNKLAARCPENASVLCDYLISEETEFNIKSSTKEGKLKTLVWLSNFFNDKLPFKKISSETAVVRGYFNK
jgi:hypothetical protein